jgi:hypothetical protein
LIIKTTVLKLVLRHDVGEATRRDVFDSLLLIKLIHRDALILQGKEEEEELVLLVFVLLYPLFHLR